MNNVDLLLLEKNNIKILKSYGLGTENICNFRKKIKKVSKEEATKLGKDLFDLLMTKQFDDNGKDFDKVVELIYNGADIEYKDDKKGDFALLRCSRKNYVNSFIVLVKAGANINQKNNFLTTATMASARHGCKTILEILILLKADINVKCLDGYTAIMSARNHKQDECFYMLVNANANLSSKDQSNNSIYTFDYSEKFDSPLLKLSGDQMIMVSFEDTQNLLEEAKEQFKKI